MNLGDMILDALKFPFSNIKRSAGLLLLLLGSILIIPAIMVAGYIFRIIKQTTNGSNELPPFDEWGEMIEDGFRYIAASVVYLIVPNILTLLLTRGMLLSVYSGGFQMSTYLLATIVGMLIALPFDLVYVMALGNMAHEGRFGAAFDFSKIFGLIGKIGWPRYVSYILIVTILGVLVGMISGLSKALQVSFGLEWGLIGIILAILIQIYLSIYRGRYTGLIYRNGSLLANGNPETKGDSKIDDIETA
jgi:hypothetical protein